MSRRLIPGLLLAAILAPLPAAVPTASESDLKAAMIFNFTKFMEWSGARGDSKVPVTVGVAGDDAVWESLEELVRDRPAGGRAVVVKRVAAPAEAEACHVVFLGRGLKKRQPDFLALAKRGVVTVGDGDAFAAAGGVIGFLVDDNKLRFEVNLAPVSQTGVTISSRLLRLAKEVRQ